MELCQISTQRIAWLSLIVQHLTGEYKSEIISTVIKIFGSHFSDFKASKNSFQCHGTLLNKNTIETFKNCDKALILKEESEKLYEQIMNGSCLNDPTLLTFFVLLSYAVSEKSIKSFDGFVRLKLKLQN